MLLESRYASDALIISLPGSQILDAVKQLLEQQGYQVTRTQQEKGATRLYFEGNEAQGSFSLQPITSVPQKYNYIYRIKILKYPSTVPQDRAINRLADQFNDLLKELPEEPLP
jgi:hypothetical protein